MAEKSLLDSIEIKTPCSESWENMQGNEEVRFCSHCVKDVHNLSAMTRQKARKLIAQSNGNLCVRYVKRPDGKVQTADRNFYQIGKRTTQFAASIFGATLSLSAIAYAQGEPVMPKQEKTIARKSDKNKTEEPASSVSGTVFDTQGSVIPDTKITLRDVKTNKIQTAMSDVEGSYKFKNIAAADYQIEAERNGFAKLTITKDVKDAVKIDLTLTVKATELVGEIVIIEEYKIAMIQAVSIGDKIQLQKLIALGRNINEKDASSHGQSALHVAVEIGNLEMIKMLLDAKADVNITDDDGETPLMIAAHNNELEIIRVLLDAGANLHLADENGKTAIQKTNSEEIRRHLQILDAVER